MSKLYNEKSIESLSPLAFTRLRPGVYCGSTEYSTQLLIEIVSNAVDEYRAGHGNLIKIETFSDGVIKVEDNGQGFIPNLLREDGKTVLEASFSVLNTSGKYSEDGVYEGTALGLNGIGAKLAIFLSNHAEVTSWRDGQYEHIWFEEGVFRNREIGTWNNLKKPSGTIVRWKPSAEFFNHVEIDSSVIKKLFDVIVCLCPGLKICFNEEEFFSANGLSDLVDEAVKGREILKNRLNINYKSGKNELDLSLTYTNNYSSTIVPYVNTGLTDSGPHITQIKTILTREMNKFFREKKWLKDKEENLSGEDCQEGLYIVFNITAPGVSYDAQTKSRIVKLDMTPFSAAIAEEIRNWLVSNEKEIKIIADKAINSRKAREAAKKAREAVRNKAEKKTVLAMPSKLADCNSSNRLECEIFVTEGDSASGGAKTIRNAKTQAVLGLRGKVLNVLTADWDKIHKNAEIMDIIRALGFSWAPDGKSVLYDPGKLRYGKFIIASDGDPDGAHIQLLVLTCLWKLVPQLILDGYVYIALPPLYKAEWGTNYEYLHDKAALENFERTHSNFTLSYFKGLGEASAAELGAMIIDPATRKLQQVTVEDITVAEQIINDLMGKDSMPKKKFVFGNEIKEIM